nr:hypothetical protein [uncultured Carboxylicivirga sp.]
MKTVFKLVLLIVVFVITTNAVSQNKSNKRTSKREIRKRQQKAYEQSRDMNAFNPMQPMGAKQNDARDDILWHSESANTVYSKAGNISVASPSRYGLKEGLEISSTLPLNYLVPNLTLKKRWMNNKWYIASKHGLYSATPGLKWAQKKKYTSVVDSSANIPLVLSMKNEFIVSRYISTDNRCSNDQPFVILTAGIGFDFGVPIGSSDLTEIRQHFGVNRSPALTGDGIVGNAKIRADWQINNMLILGGDLKYFRGDFTGNHAFEQSTQLQTFVIPMWSISFGYIVSFADYNLDSKWAIIPFLDLNWYFGKKKGRERGLWDRKMF